MMMNAICHIRNVIETLRHDRMLGVWWTNELETDPVLLMTIANRSDESIARTFDRWFATNKTRFEWWVS